MLEGTAGPTELSRRRDNCRKEGGKEKERENSALLAMATPGQQVDVDVYMLG